MLYVGLFKDLSLCSHQTWKNTFWQNIFYYDINRCSFWPTKPMNLCHFSIRLVFFLSQLSFFTHWIQSDAKTIHSKLGTYLREGFDDLYCPPPLDGDAACLMTCLKRCSICERGVYFRIKGSKHSELHIDFLNLCYSWLKMIMGCTRTELQFQSNQPHIHSYHLVQ